MNDDEYVETIVARPRSAPPILLVHSLGSLAGSESAFSGGIVHLGRRRDCELRFDSHEDRMVSSRHARLTQEDGRWFLEDLGSTNGTLVNGTEITGRIALAVGDQVVLGIIGTPGSVGFEVAFGDESPAEKAPAVASEPVRPSPIPPAASPDARLSAPNPQLRHEIAERIALLEESLKAARAEADLAATRLGRAMWLRGGIDWSGCDGVTELLALERRAHEVKQMQEDVECDEVADVAGTQESRAELEARIGAALAELNAARAAHSAAEVETRSNDESLRIHCNEAFAALDELSLVIADTIAKHRPIAEDDVAVDLESLRERLLAANATNPSATAALASLLARRTELRAALVSESKIAEHRERTLVGLRGDLAGIEAAFSKRQAEREATRIEAKQAAAEVDSQFDQRFTALGNEVLNRRTQAAAMFEEHDEAVRKRAAVAQTEREWTERTGAKNASGGSCSA